MISLCFIDGAAVLTRENGQTTDLVFLTDDFSAAVAAHPCHRSEEWVAAVLAVAESVPDHLIEARQTRLHTIH